MLLVAAVQNRYARNSGGRRCFLVWRSCSSAISANPITRIIHGSSSGYNAAVTGRILLFVVIRFCSPKVNRRTGFYLVVMPRHLTQLSLFQWNSGIAGLLLLLKPIMLIFLLDSSFSGLFNEMLRYIYTYICKSTNNYLQRCGSRVRNIIYSQTPLIPHRF